MASLARHPALRGNNVACSERGAYTPPAVPVRVIPAARRAVVQQRREQPCAGHSYARARGAAPHRRGRRCPDQPGRRGLRLCSASRPADDLSNQTHARRGQRLAAHRGESPPCHGPPDRGCSHDKMTPPPLCARDKFSTCRARASARHAGAARRSSRSSESWSPDARVCALPVWASSVCPARCACLGRGALHAQRISLISAGGARLAVLPRRLHASNWRRGAAPLASAVRLGAATHRPFAMSVGASAGAQALTALQP